MEFKQERFILCEGEHDKFFLETLIEERQLGLFQIETAEGCTGIPGHDGFGPALYGFEPVIGFSDLKGIGIVTDNDNRQKLTNLVRRLRVHGYDPTPSAQVGNIYGKPVIIILIPDDKIYGNLERLCLPVLYDKWPGSEKCVEKYLECTGANRWTNQNKISKAIIRSAIAGYHKDDPLKGFHHLFQNKTFSACHKCFDDLADILKRFDAIIAAGKF
ncbi:MAG: DUF3226 domain-containing protein [Pseudomonadota bacterium]